MSKNLLINDTAEVTITRKSDGHTVLMYESQLASISQAVTEERLYGGLGNKTVAIPRTQKEIDLTARNALWNAEYIAMTQGVTLSEDTVTIKKQYTATVADNAGTLEATINGTTTATEGVFYDKDDSQEPVTITTGVFDLPVGATAVAGDTVEVIVKEDVTGEVAVFDSETFSEKYEIQYYTIAYDPDTMKVVQDVYIQFDEVVPSGNFEMSFENGTPLTPEMNFMVLTPKASSEMGRIVRVDRV